MLEHIKTLISFIKKSREAQGLSQQLLASKVGIPQSHISKIERGSVNLKLTSFLEIARALGLEVMLVPRQNVTAIKAIVESEKRGRERSIRPAYVLDDEDAEEEL